MADTPLLHPTVQKMKPKDVRQERSVNSDNVLKPHVLEGVLVSLLSVDGVLWLDRSSGLDREHGHCQQLPAAVPLLVPEHLARQRKLL